LSRTSEVPMDRDQFMQAAKDLVDASDGRLTLVFNEEDATSEQGKAGAAHFLKLDGRRLGRDIELYAFMSEVGGARNGLVDFASEVIVPLKSASPSAYSKGCELMKQFGALIFSGTELIKWCEVFAEP
jgi:hypothetical protein